MKNKTGKLTGIIAFILVILYILIPDGADKKTGGDAPGPSPAGNADISASETILRDGFYYSRDDICGYLSLYGELPPNFITKSEARSLGWDSDEGNLWDVADGYVIGGDTFGNREKILPGGVKYFECDANYNGGFRGDDRIVYSSDGNIYFTSDHYNTFEFMGKFEVK